LPIIGGNFGFTDTDEPPGDFGIRENVRLTSGVEFSVLSVSQSGVEVPDSFLIDDPRGRLVSITVRISNYSSETITVSRGDFTGLGNGAEFDSSGITEASGDSAFLEDLSPGISSTFRVYFDVPIGRDLDGLIFRPSLFSGSAEIAF
jgi:hypothetical protein